MHAAVYLLCLALCANRVFSYPLKSANTGTKLASVDEVNVLMYGVLQFSESLHHIYQSTESRIARVMKAISRTESEMKRLGQDTEVVAQTEREIKEKLHLIQTQMEGLQAEAQQNKGTINRVEQEEAELKKKLSNLEENLNSSISDKITDTTLKKTAVLKDLMKWTQEQKLKLENQNQQLVELQKQNVL